MTPESRAILDKWLARGADWLTSADIASGHAVARVSVVGGEFASERIDPEKYFRMLDEAADEIRRTVGTI